MEAQEKIMNMSLSLFFKYGIRHVTMDDIARELGMSKKTIYQFCREKDDLVNQLCERELRAQEKEFGQLGKDARDPVHEITLISARLRQMMQGINPTFFLDLQKFYPTAFARFSKFREECAFKNIVDNVQRGIKAGIYRSDLDPEFIARYRLAQLDMLMFGNNFSTEKHSFAALHERMLELFVYGICTLKGHKLVNQYMKNKEED